MHAEMFKILADTRDKSRTASQAERHVRPDLLGDFHHLVIIHP